MWESYNTYDTIKSKLEFISDQVETLNSNKNYIIKNLKLIQHKKNEEISEKTKEQSQSKLDILNDKKNFEKNDKFDRDRRVIDDSSMVSNALSEIASDNTIHENLISYNSIQRFKNMQNHPKNLYS